MSRDTLSKAAKDFTATLDEQLPQINALAEQDYKGALDKLLLLEKQTRQASDLASSNRIMISLVDLLTKHNDWKMLNEQFSLLSKKHGQLKQSVTTLIQQVIGHLDEITDIDLKIKSIENLRTTTENKIYVEIERARVTKILSDILLSRGDLDKATEILCELQVETYGSMELQEKIEFILNQVELCNKKGDYQFAKILSRKVLVKSLEKFPELKLKFYQLKIAIANDENDYISIVRYYLSIYEIPFIQENRQEYLSTLTNAVYFIMLSKYSNLQSDLISKIAVDKNLPKIPTQQQLIKTFTTQELISWESFQQAYATILFQHEVFDQSTTKGKQHLEDLKSRVIEHNLRVISTYYSCITLKRLQELLQLTQSQVEHNITTLVNDGTIYAKVNRPSKVVDFVKRKTENELLNTWSSNVDELLEHIETIEHLVNKEEMMKSLTA
ncbi:26S proteasome regulatory subunit [Komagataella phaffii CBS 7435]|uniref:26S proteasome regulatory subunit n=1 Tax=Komagataella phaffii (strain ATCC 76273 / CBS 7435 / CECT 11047 / NRRL Y-11430 / Wegner 21-1) TaxID=981350 RepID=F2QP26_KOMPC|nr:GQ67_02884T0 [Komagataella phaffii]AOA65830.1 GQ68_02363T0 [Komagataella phaffii GS115]CAH2446433.1 26S proteasome regulatory subunit [Komagataella phaffii CBS 7435]CCA36768.1 26S proteasome regulatory subunit [Komagataella phaffii CBS 7435]